MVRSWYDVKNTYFPTMILSAWRNRAQVDYGTAKDVTLLRNVGTALSEGLRSIGFLCHVNGNHWTSIMINPAMGRVYYGDSKCPLTP
ncbi:hypothetical protein PAXRUDRAFT_823986 [Paxillus rubicundulus Ve08.2h10]|uniref:Ubiquitin-like protease family profile domain-containing protein n=1 Tax=Paxillus rubicundulus Ve08.2h10 TaxID=930991 RepID=A0A0D0E889_9AGAM|nr:hypothetical protein PAXRUDRAFT_823986 [Paxillus rubicundulus Ve08.2h10]